MLIEKKVDLVLSGHDHVYQRTHQLGTGAGLCLATAAPPLSPRTAWPTRTAAWCRAAGPFSPRSESAASGCTT